jgi:hypothetical protein
MFWKEHHKNFQFLQPLHGTSCTFLPAVLVWSVYLIASVMSVIIDVGS